MKPTERSFLPTSAAATATPVAAREIFSFLRTGRAPPNPNSPAQHDICVGPEASRVPWPTSFPAARQCRYWEAAQTACERLIHESRVLRSREGKLLPKGFLCADSNHDVLTRQERAIVDTAVSAAIYIVPNAPVERIKIIAQLFMLLWTHDEMLTAFPLFQGETVVDTITQYMYDLSKNDGSIPENTIVSSIELSPELLNEGHGLLRVVLGHFCSFVFFTREQQRTQFQDIRDFLNYRATDIAADFVSACIRFGNQLDLNAQELKGVQHLVDVASDHMTLINDLFSFNKEKKASIEEGALFLNTVHYIETVLEINSLLAKDVTLSLAQDYEAKIEAEIMRLRQGPPLGHQQWSYVYAMVEAASGNLLFSITSIRYGAKTT
ncbi:terpenoid synthase [Aspergillus indologenus CBS 114.80]|uniref:Terpenoid synthase n=1 Tax=Aspergillus indologenus CBS 114.80 TaxID=1450541 RepID=A0A2V5IS97_9EURO|nr:terpenoid synthase [Aspergillus indologenus CBS 114.80]